MNAFLAACQFPHFGIWQPKLDSISTNKNVLTYIKMIGKSEVNTCAGAEAVALRRKSVVIQALDGNEDGENADQAKLRRQWSRTSCIYN